jgi:outer membrane protein
MDSLGKKLLMTIAIAILTGGLHIGPARSVELKIGSVDIHKVVNECNEGKEDKKALAKKVEDIQRLIVEKQKELQEMRESLEKQAVTLTPEVRGTKEKELQTRVRDFQRWGQDKENEIKQQQAEMERKIATGLQKVIQKLGDDEGYTLILNKSENIVFFASKTIDITDRVIKAYDTQRK